MTENFKGLQIKNGQKDPPTTNDIDDFLFNLSSDKVFDSDFEDLSENDEPLNDLENELEEDQIEDDGYESQINNNVLDMGIYYETNILNSDFVNDLPDPPKKPQIINSFNLMSELNLLIQQDNKRKEEEKNIQKKKKYLEEQKKIMKKMEKYNIAKQSNEIKLKYLKYTKTGLKIGMFVSLSFVMANSPYLMQMLGLWGWDFLPDFENDKEGIWSTIDNFPKALRTIDIGYRKWVELDGYVDEWAMDCYRSVSNDGINGLFKYNRTLIIKNFIANISHNGLPLGLLPIKVLKIPLVQSIVNCGFTLALSAMKGGSKQKGGDDTNNSEDGTGWSLNLASTGFNVIYSPALELGKDWGVDLDIWINNHKNLLDPFNKYSNKNWLNMMVDPYCNQFSGQYLNDAANQNIYTEFYQPHITAEERIIQEMDQEANNQKQEKEKTELSKEVKYANRVINKANTVTQEYLKASQFLKNDYKEQYMSGKIDYDTYKEKLDKIKNNTDKLKKQKSKEIKEQVKNGDIDKYQATKMILDLEYNEQYYNNLNLEFSNNSLYNYFDFNYDSVFIKYLGSIAAVATYFAVNKTLNNYDKAISDEFQENQKKIDEWKGIQTNISNLTFEEQLKMSTKDEAIPVSASNIRYQQNMLKKANLKAHAMNKLYVSAAKIGAGYLQFKLVKDPTVKKIIDVINRPELLSQMLRSSFVPKAQELVKKYKLVEKITYYSLYSTLVFGNFLNSLYDWIKNNGYNFKTFLDSNYVPEYYELNWEKQNYDNIIKNFSMKDLLNMTDNIPLLNKFIYVILGMGNIEKGKKRLDNYVNTKYANILQSITLENFLQNFVNQKVNNNLFGTMNFVTQVVENTIREIDVKSVFPFEADIQRLNDNPNSNSIWAMAFRLSRTYSLDIFKDKIFNSNNDLEFQKVESVLNEVLQNQLLSQGETDSTDSTDSEFTPNIPKIDQSKKYLMSDIQKAFESANLFFDDEFYSKYEDGSGNLDNNKFENMKNELLDINQELMKFIQKNENPSCQQVSDFFKSKFSIDYNVENLKKLTNNQDQFTSKQIKQFIKNIGVISQKSNANSFDKTKYMIYKISKDLGIDEKEVKKILSTKKDDLKKLDPESKQQYLRIQNYMQSHNNEINSTERSFILDNIKDFLNRQKTGEYNIDDLETMSSHIESLGDIIINDPSFNLGSKIRKDHPKGFMKSLRKTKDDYLKLIMHDPQLVAEFNSLNEVDQKARILTEELKDLSIALLDLDENYHLKSVDSSTLYNKFLKDPIMKKSSLLLSESLKKLTESSKSIFYNMFNPSYYKESVISKFEDVTNKFSDLLDSSELTKDWLFSGKYDVSWDSYIKEEEMKKAQVLKHITHIDSEIQSMRDDKCFGASGTSMCIQKLKLGLEVDKISYEKNQKRERLIRGMERDKKRHQYQVDEYQRNIDSAIQSQNYYDESKAKINELEKIENKSWSEYTTLQAMKVFNNFHSFIVKVFTHPDSRNKQISYSDAFMYDDNFKQKLNNHVETIDKILAIESNNLIDESNIAKRDSLKTELGPKLKQFKIQYDMFQQLSQKDNINPNDILTNKRFLDSFESFFKELNANPKYQEFYKISEKQDMKRLLSNGIKSDSIDTNTNQYANQLKNMVQEETLDQYLIRIDSYIDKNIAKDQRRENETDKEYIHRLQLSGYIKKGAPGLFNIDSYRENLIETEFDLFLRSLEQFDFKNLTPDFREFVDKINGKSIDYQNINPQERSELIKKIKDHILNIYSIRDTYLKQVNDLSMFNEDFNLKSGILESNIEKFSKDWNEFNKFTNFIDIINLKDKTDKLLEDSKKEYEQKKSELFRLKGGFNGNGNCIDNYCEDLDEMIKKEGEEINNLESMIAIDFGLQIYSLSELDMLKNKYDPVHNIDNDLSRLIQNLGANGDLSKKMHIFDSLVDDKKDELLTQPDLLETLDFIDDLVLDMEYLDKMSLLINNFDSDLGKQVKQTSADFKSKNSELMKIVKSLRNPQNLTLQQIKDNLIKLDSIVAKVGDDFVFNSGDATQNINLSFITKNLNKLLDDNQRHDRTLRKLELKYSWSSSGSVLFAFDDNVKNLDSQDFGILTSLERESSLGTSNQKKIRRIKKHNNILTEQKVLIEQLGEYDAESNSRNEWKQQSQLLSNIQSMIKKYPDIDLSKFKNQFTTLLNAKIDSEYARVLKENNDKFSEELSEFESQFASTTLISVKQGLLYNFEKKIKSYEKPLSFFGPKVINPDENLLLKSKRIYDRSNKAFINQQHREFNDLYKGKLEVDVVTYGLPNDEKLSREKFLENIRNKINNSLSLETGQKLFSDQEISNFEIKYQNILRNNNREKHYDQLKQKLIGLNPNTKDVLDGKYNPDGFSLLLLEIEPLIGSGVTDFSSKNIKKLLDDRCQSASNSPACLYHENHDLFKLLATLEQEKKKYEQMESRKSNALDIIQNTNADLYKLGNTDSKTIDKAHINKIYLESSKENQELLKSYNDKIVKILESYGAKIYSNDIFSNNLINNLMSLENLIGIQPISDDLNNLLNDFENLGINNLYFDLQSIEATNQAFKDLTTQWDEKIAQAKAEAAQAEAEAAQAQEKAEEKARRKALRTQGRKRIDAKGKFKVRQNPVLEEGEGQDLNDEEEEEVEVIEDEVEVFKEDIVQQTKIKDIQKKINSLRSIAKEESKLDEILRIENSLALNLDIFQLLKLEQRLDQLTKEINILQQQEISDLNQVVVLDVETNTKTNTTEKVKNDEDKVVDKEEVDIIDTNKHRDAFMLSLGDRFKHLKLQINGDTTKIENIKEFEKDLKNFEKFIECLNALKSAFSTGASEDLDKTQVLKEILSYNSNFSLHSENHEQYENPEILRYNRDGSLETSVFGEGLGSDLGEQLKGYNIKLRDLRADNLYGKGDDSKNGINKLSDFVKNELGSHFHSALVRHDETYNYGNFKNHEDQSSFSTREDRGGVHKVANSVVPSIHSFGYNSAVDTAQAGFALYTGVTAAAAATTWYGVGSAVVGAVLPGVTLVAKVTGGIVGAVGGTVSAPVLAVGVVASGAAYKTYEASYHTHGGWYNQYIQPSDIEKWDSKNGIYRMCEKTSYFSSENSYIGCGKFPEGLEKAIDSHCYTSTITEMRSDYIDGKLVEIERVQGYLWNSDVNNFESRFNDQMGQCQKKAYLTLSEEYNKKRKRFNQDYEINSPKRKMIKQDHKRNKDSGWNQKLLDDLLLSFQKLPDNHKLSEKGSNKESLEKVINKYKQCTTYEKSKCLSEDEFDILEEWDMENELFKDIHNYMDGFFVYDNKGNKYKQDHEKYGELSKVPYKYEEKIGELIKNEDEIKYTQQKKILQKMLEIYESSGLTSEEKTNLFRLKQHFAAKEEFKLKLEKDKFGNIKYTDQKGNDVKPDIDVILAIDNLAEDAFKKLYIYDEAEKLTGPDQDQDAAVKYLAKFEKSHSSLLVLNKQKVILRTSLMDVVKDYPNISEDTIEAYVDESLVDDKLIGKNHSQILEKLISDGNVSVEDVRLSFRAKFGGDSKFAQTDYYKKYGDTMTAEEFDELNNEIFKNYLLEQQTMFTDKFIDTPKKKLKDELEKELKITSEDQSNKIIMDKLDHLVKENFTNSNSDLSQILEGSYNWNIKQISTGFWGYNEGDQVKGHYVFKKGEKGRESKSTDYATGKIINGTPDEGLLQGNVEVQWEIKGKTFTQHVPLDWIASISENQKVYEPLLRPQSTILKGGDGTDFSNLLGEKWKDKLIEKQTDFSLNEAGMFGFTSQASAYVDEKVLDTLTILVNSSPNIVGDEETIRKMFELKEMVNGDKVRSGIRILESAYDTIKNFNTYVDSNLLLKENKEIYNWLKTLNDLQVKHKRYKTNIFGLSNKGKWAKAANFGTKQQKEAILKQIDALGGDLGDTVRQFFGSGVKGKQLDLTNVDVREEWEKLLEIEKVSKWNKVQTALGLAELGKFANAQFDLGSFTINTMNWMANDLVTNGGDDCGVNNKLIEKHKESLVQLKKLYGDGDDSGWNYVPGVESAKNFNAYTNAVSHLSKSLPPELYQQIEGQRVWTGNTWGNTDNKQGIMNDIN